MATTTVAESNGSSSAGKESCATDDRMNGSMKGHSNSPFVMPMKRGINCEAPDFDPQGFVDLVAEDVGLIQRMKLQEILSHNGNVEYLQRHGLNGRTDAASFKKCVPVVSYADMQPDILRLVNGETAPILTADPISEFSLRSVLVSSILSERTILKIKPVAECLQLMTTLRQKGAHTDFTMLSLWTPHVCINERVNPNWL